jgi:hypothetical protein
MVNLSISKRAREGALKKGQMTRDVVYGIIADASMPLTINEINSLYKGLRGKTLSREYLRMVLDAFVESKQLLSRSETKAERELRGSSRGADALLFYTSSTRATRTSLPKVPFKITVANSSSGARNKSKKKDQAKKKSAPSANDLINILIADRTKHLEDRIARLETKLSRIRAIAK